MKIFDNYEISPCTRTEKPDSPGKFYFEVCEPHEADVWTLHGHIDGEGVQAVGDFATRERAEEVFSLITGMAFAESREVNARLRAMHTGMELLAALRTVVETEFDHDEESRNHNDDRLDYFSKLIAKAEGRAA